MNIRDDAFEDWKKGMKYKEIAEKYEVSLSTVKSWASRHWKKDENKKVATIQKKTQPSKEKLQPTQYASSRKKKGAPVGNKNAKGNQGGGAPKRNQNNFRHGAYAKIYWDTLDETEQSLLEDIPVNDEEYQYQQQLALFTIRERRLMIRIKKLQEDGDKSKGLFLKGVIREKKLEYVGTVKTDSGTKDNVADITDTTTTETEAIINTLMVLEEELTKVQKAKTKCLDSLARLHLEKQKLDKGAKGNAIVDDWIDAVLEGGTYEE